MDFKDLMTGGPIVRLGTKCPSITSTWMKSAPPASTVRIASPRHAKSAERIDGAIRIESDTSLPFGRYRWWQ